MSRLAELELGTAATTPFSWKRRRSDGVEVECKVLVRVLTPYELDCARIEAVKYVRNLGANHLSEPNKRLEIENASDREVVEDSRQIEVLAIALRNTKNAAEPFATPMQLRQMLTNDEVAVLWRVYEAHQDMQGPIVRGMSEEQFEALVQALVEDADNDPLLCFAYSARRLFTRSMACQLVISRTDNVLCTSQFTRLLNEFNKLRQQSGRAPIADVAELGPQDPELTTEPAA
jgi:hypothetical protein